MTRSDNQLDTHILGQRTMAVRTFQSVTAQDWTSIDVTYPSGTTETYTYKKGAETIAIITVTYEDSTKDKITNVARE